MKKLISELKAIDEFSDEDVQFFVNALEEKFIPKGEHFLKEGQISQHLGYIVKGLTMHYKIVDGTEIPIDFQYESDWVAYLKSFSTGSISDMNIKVLEDTHLLTLSNESMKKLFSTQPKLVSIRSYYTELSFTKNTQHAANLATLNAKERYYKFMSTYPDLINRIPQYYIAAYLGIKPQSLSRLRK